VLHAREFRVAARTAAVQDAAVRLTIADPSLVLLVGPSGAGKSTFAGRHFAANQVISSDDLRAALSDDPNDQAASAEAFQVMALLVRGRLRRRLMTVVDATNLRASARRRWLRLAARYGVPAVAICFDYSLDAYLALNRRRPGRQVEAEVVRSHAELMTLALTDLIDEGYASTMVFRSPDEMSAADVEVGR
jgi:predicted kinase